MKRFLLSACCALAVAIAGFLPSASAELSDVERDKLSAIDQSLQKVVTLYKSKKYDEVTTLVTEIDGMIKGLASDTSSAELLAHVGPLQTRLEAAQRLVAAQLALRAAAAEMAQPERRPTPNRPAPRPAGGDGVSFVADVAPILVSKCQGCHIRGSRGNFSLATFADLMRGTPDGGPVFQPGKGPGSRLIDLLESGAMPPNGNACSPEEIALVTKWIDAGAPFDGPNPGMQLTALVTGGAAMTGDLAAARATGNESVSFMRDIAPVLADNCINCHSGDRPSENLSLATFAGIFEGGRSGQVITPGRAASSLLLKKLKGTAPLGQQMPLNGGPLSPDVIAKFETWVAEGAKFDGPDPRQSIDLLVRIALAKKMTHEELAALRSNTAQRNWKTSNTDETPASFETEDFVLWGNVTPVRLEEVAHLAETARKKVAANFKVPADKPMFKGKLTVFVFNRRFDYTEFTQMVEKREAPREAAGSWFYNVVNAYICIQPNDPLNNADAAVLAEGIAGAYLDSFSDGQLPRWFAFGVARNYAARMEPNNPIAKQTDEAVTAALKAPGQLDGFLTTRNLDARGMALSYGFVKGLMKDTTRFQALLTALKGGTRFDQAFQNVYRADPKTAFATWARTGR